MHCEVRDFIIKTCLAAPLSQKYFKLMALDSSRLMESMSAFGFARMALRSQHELNSHVQEQSRVC